MKRLLCIVSSMNRGGAETFLMKIYRELDKTKFQMDFCVFTYEEGHYDKEIKQMGGKIYNLPMKTKNPIKSFNSIKKLVKKNGYDNVIRLSSSNISTIDLLASKWGGAKNLILRSTNTKSSNKITHKFINFVSCWMPRFIPTVKVAPSTEAGKYLFGKRAIKKNKVHILNNAIDTNQFYYDEDIRIKTRKELNIENKFVVGHIGRFSQQKNHKFLIKVFNEIKKVNDNAILMLIGKGELRDEVFKQVEEYNLEDDVLFLGIRDDVPQLLMAMDVMVFPSFYEGLPNVIVEAQGASLPCLISSAITKEVKLTEFVMFNSLKNDAKDWANKAIELYECTNRRNTKEDLINQGYDIKEMTEHFISLTFNNDN